MNEILKDTIEEVFDEYTVDIFGESVTIKNKVEQNQYNIYRLIFGQKNEKFEELL